MDIKELENKIIAADKAGATKEEMQQLHDYYVSVKRKSTTDSPMTIADQVPPKDIGNVSPSDYAIQSKAESKPLWAAKPFKADGSFMNEIVDPMLDPLRIAANVPSNAYQLAKGMVSQPISAISETAKYFTEQDLPSSLKYLAASIPEGVAKGTLEFANSIIPEFAKQIYHADEISASWNDLVKTTGSSWNAAKAITKEIFSPTNVKDFNGKIIDSTIQGFEKARISAINSPVTNALQTYGTLKTAQYGINVAKTAKTEGVGAATKGIVSDIQTEAGKAYNATKSASNAVKNTVSHPIDTTGKIIDSVANKFSSVGNRFTRNGAQAVSNRIINQAQDEALKYSDPEYKAYLKEKTDLLNTEVSKRRADYQATLDLVQKNIDDFESAAQSLTDARVQDGINLAHTEKGRLEENAFKSDYELGQAVKGDFITDKNDISGLYKKSLGDHPIDLTKPIKTPEGEMPSVIDTARSVEKELRRQGKITDADFVAKKVGDLEIRSLVTKYGSDIKGLTNELLNSENRAKGLFEIYNEKPENYQPLTSDTMKSIREELVDINTTPFAKGKIGQIQSALDDTYKQVLKDTDAQAYSSVIKADNLFSDRARNPLINKIKNTPDGDIPKIAEMIRKAPEAQINGTAEFSGVFDLMRKEVKESVQNYFAKEVLIDAENINNGTFNAKIIADKTAELLQKNLITKEQSSILNNVKDAIDPNSMKQLALEQAIKEDRAMAKEVKRNVETESEQSLKQSEANLKLVGENPGEMASKIKRIKSVDDLKTFMETIDETDPKKLGTVVINDTIDANYSNLFTDSPETFDIPKAKSVLSTIESIRDDIKKEIFTPDQLNWFKKFENDLSNASKLSKASEMSLIHRVLNLTLTGLYFSQGWWPGGANRLREATKSNPQINTIKDKYK